MLVVTKDVLAAGSTRWAQGGIAAALGPDDTAEAHLADTLVAGVGICDVEAVRVLVDEGPQAVRELIELGTRFDRSSTGELSLTREGGHHADRIAHAGGDATGAEIERALVAAVLATPGIEVIEHALVLDLLPTAAGGVGAVTLHVMGEGQLDGVGAVRARAFVLATGGIGQVYAATTNPPVSTGDGVAAALRAGAVVRDLEFVQFHPTVLWLGGARGRPAAAGQRGGPRRGRGAARRRTGVRFMQGQHELADLAPRDVVAKAILRRMRETGAEHVWLDARHFGAEKWRVRFPTILATLTSLGLDPVTRADPGRAGLPLRLRRHRHRPDRPHLGGRAVRLRRGGLHRGARRQPAGLELAAGGPGVRPADRGRRAAHRAARRRPLLDLGIDVRGSGIAAAGIRRALQRAMSADAGVIRDAAGLARAAGSLQKLAAQRSSDPRTESWEATNLLTVASALVAAASRRAETRGSHWREDYPERDDEHWCGHLDLRLGPDGTITTDYRPIPTHREDRAMTDSIDPAILDALHGAGLDAAHGRRPGGPGAGRGSGRRPGRHHRGHHRRRADRPGRGGAARGGGASRAWRWPATSSRRSARAGSGTAAGHRRQHRASGPGAAERVRARSGTCSPRSGRR